MPDWSMVAVATVVAFVASLITTGLYLANRKRG